MISGIGSSTSGLEAVESRVNQLEGMLKAIEARRAALLAETGAAPGLPVDPLGEKRPFQFYLQGTPAAGKSAALNERAQLAQPMVERLSSQYGLDKHLVNALIRQESGFNPNAVSKAGAMGFMQLMPGTARDLGVNPADPAQNLEGGMRYLRGLIDQFHGNIPLALAAYNAGPAAVKRHKGIPPYEETQQYVRNILSMYLKAKQSEA